MALQYWSDGDILYASALNSTVSTAYMNIIRSAMNAGNSKSLYNRLYFDTFEGDTATTKVGWTYDGTNKRYNNVGSSGSAVLECKNLLGSYQKFLLSGERNIFFVPDEFTEGDTTSSTISNYNFETGSSAWTITLGGTTVKSMDTGSRTEGTQSLKLQYTGNAGATNTIVQNVVIPSGATQLFVDARCDSQNANVGASSIVVSLGSPTTGSIVSNTVGISSAGPAVVGWSPCVVPIGSMTGSQIITITSAFSGNSAGTACGAWIDNIRFTIGSTTQTTRLYKASYDGGTTWTTISPNIITALPSNITDLGIRIEDTRTSAGSTLYNYINGFGILYG